MQEVIRKILNYIFVKKKKIHFIEDSELDKNENVIKKITNEESLEMIEKKFSDDYFNSSFSGRKTNAIINEIQDNIRNYRSNSPDNMEYIRNMRRNELILLIVLYNQCYKSLGDSLEEKNEIRKASFVI